MNPSDYPREFSHHYQRIQAKENKRGGKPEKAGLVTKSGRFFEKLSILQVLLSTLTLIIVCTLYYYYATPFGNGITGGQNFWRSGYFSVVTFSSLGYGELLPVHYGKVVAALEVTFGLGLTALLIGKIASERQMALLTFVYTSEQQYRIHDFAENLSSYANQIQAAIRDYDIAALAEAARHADNLTRAYTRYLVMHANHGDIAAFGNRSALNKLYAAVIDLQEAAFEALYTEGITKPCQNALEDLIVVSSGNTRVLIPQHRSMNALEQLAKILAAEPVLTLLIQDRENDALVYRHRRRLTPELLDTICARMGERPWPQGIHRTVAEELQITRTLATEAITHLIQTGRLPAAE